MIALAAFLDALRASGMECTEPHRIATTGELCRFHVEGDRHGSRNGWAVLFDDGRAAGAYGHWRSGLQGTWAAHGSERINAVERDELRRMIEAARRQRAAEREDEHKAAAVRAASFWVHTTEANPAHPYLVRKRIRAHGIRQQGIALAVPLRDADGVLWSVETIMPDGTKRFMRGGRKAGCWHLIGTVTHRLAIAEGYATAASVYEAAGWPCAVAFDAGNLRAVAVALRAQYPAIDLVIAADNDPAGITKGREAAAAARGRIAVARLPGESIHGN